MNNHTTVAKIASTTSRLEKEEIIREQANLNNEHFFVGLRLAYDPLITFGVKKVPLHCGVDGPGLSFDAFAVLAKKLEQRLLTGHDARDSIIAAMHQATQKEWDGWYRLILMKDLKAGFSEVTVNRVCKKTHPQYCIQTFECQLAKDSTDDTGNIDEDVLTGQKFIEVKLDGVRLLSIVYPNGRVLQTSRNGKELVNFEKIKKQLEHVASTFTEPTVLDGEVMSASFQDLMKQARRKTNVQADDSVLNLFDIIPLSEFLKGKGTKSQRDRTRELNLWFDTVSENLPNVTVVGAELVDLSTDSGKARLYEINKLALAGNYEGIMIKDPNAVYECKRSKNWLKKKPTITVDLTVVSVEEGKPDSNFVGTMGALIMAGSDDGKLIRVNVGSGFSVQLRAQIWATHTNKPVTWAQKTPDGWSTITEQPCTVPIVGQIAEILADAVTKSENNEHYSLRFPRFNRWRGFEPGEKI